MNWTKTTARWDEKHISFRIWCALYLRFDRIIYLISVYFCLFHCILILSIDNNIINEHNLCNNPSSGGPVYIFRADSRLAPSQWETLLQSSIVSHWLGTNLESALILQDSKQVHTLPADIPVTNSAKPSTGQWWRSSETYRWLNARLQ